MSKSIDYFNSQHPLRRLATRTALRARHKMFKLFMQVMQPSEQDRVLDLGVTPDNSLEDSNFFEQLYPHTHRITASSIEDAQWMESHYKGLKFIQANGKALPFADKSFDIVFCSAVLEHVGNRAEQRLFISEILRVSHSFFLTTPNKSFPIELHTFLPLIHWLPQNKHQMLLRKLGHDFWAKTDNLNLLNTQDLLSLFPDTQQPNIKRNYLLGLPSNLISYRK